MFFLFLLGVVLSLGLYFVKTWVQTAKSETATLEVELLSEREVVSTLRSELSHLESPARINKLTAEQFVLGVTRVEQIIELDDIERRFPLKSELFEEVDP